MRTDDAADDADDTLAHIAALAAVWQHRGRDGPAPPCPVCGAYAVAAPDGRLVTHHVAAAHGVGPADGPAPRPPRPSALAAVRRALGEREADD